MSSWPSISTQQSCICNIVAKTGRLCFHCPMTTTSSTPTTSDLLRTAGVKVTPGRVRVLDALIAAAAPLSHADLEAQMPDADRVTLYRVLDSLVACGLTLKAVDPRGVFRFSASSARQEHQSHMHFRCTDCGGVFCLKSPPPPPPKLPYGFVFGALSLDISGLCKNCNQARQNSPQKDTDQ